MRTELLLSSLVLAAAGAAQSPDSARVDAADLARHYQAVEAELRAAPAPANAAAAARRRLVIELLREYRERGDFGIDRSGSGARVPLFVDADGRRCAVANLLDRTGHAAVTEAIRSHRNHAWVIDLVSDPALAQWLANHGLSAAEAARIQGPGYTPPGTEPPPDPPPEPRDPPPNTQPGDVTAPPPPVTSPRPAAGTTPARPAVPPTPSVAAGTRRARGTTIDELGVPTWQDWWQWNRAVFEPPQPVAAAAANVTTADARRTEVQALLAELARDATPMVRAAAVLAAGRAGASIADLTPHLTDGAREVRLMALLALGSAGSAAHARALGTWIESAAPGDTLAVALTAAAMIGDQSLQRVLAPGIERHLADQRATVHAAAALAATAHGSAHLLAAAREVAQGAASPLQRAAMLPLLGGNASDDDVAALTRLVGDRSVDVRRAAALALGRTRHALALPALQLAFELEHEVVTKAMLLFAIGDHGGDAGEAFLLAAMRDGSKTLRANAALALGLHARQRDPAARSPIAAALVKALADERNRDQQGAYLLAIGLLQHGPSLDLLAQHLANGQVSSTRSAAAMALGLIGDAAALAPLRQAIANDSCPAVRLHATTALGRLGAPAIDALVAALRDDSSAPVQRNAAIALGAIADARAFDALRSFAKDASAPADARAGVALGLGRAYRRSEPKLPALRFQRDHGALPAIVAWAFAQDL